jgi:magnesium chelatase subunit D
MAEELVPEAWARVRMALRLLAVDPSGLGGLWLRGRAGAVRDRVVVAFDALPAPVTRVHPGVGDDVLYGGLDVTATLALGRPVRTMGLLQREGSLVLAMAERCPPGLAARLATALDAGTGPLIALDEAAEPDEGLPASLADRLGLFVDLDGIAWSDTGDLELDAGTLAQARARLWSVKIPKDAIARLTKAAVALGITSLRAPSLALAAARAHAALSGRNMVTGDDLRAAAEAVYAHRALPQTEQSSEPPPPEPPQDAPPDAETQTPTDTDRLPDEILVEAARAALPADLLARLAAGAANRAAKGAAGTGAERSGNRRGRPLPSRPGRLGTGARIDLVATLRQAAPWQPMRRAAAGPTDAVLLVRPSDIRLKRFREMSDRVLVFAVDASGSSAFARLSEAKGAVELLLAAAYARRDHVALLAFRGLAAELILPPTRSLVQTKRRLAGLPGGGGTPLAAGLQMAMATALQARARGLTPTIALLTDGRGNIALDGSANRAQAEADTQKLAAAIRASGLPTLVIDTGARAQPALEALARLMQAPYLALPRADAHRLSAVLSGALGG